MEEKRRLPSWMIGASAATKVSKPLDLDANDIITNEKLNVETKSTKPKAKSKPKKEICPSSDDDKSVLVKCETKRKKRKIVEKEVTEAHDSKQEVIVEKKKLRRVRKKVEEVHHSRKKKENNAQSSDEEEDDDDLTMEDLLTIAKQFVENDKGNTGQQKSSERLPKRNSSHSSSSTTTTSLITPQDTKSPIHEQTAIRYKSTENTKSEVISEGITMTGDPAQDMLELLLGPLLKKPIQKKEDNFIDNMILHHEVKKPQHDAVVSNKPLNFAKKKSSLRDAVAMFLD